MPSKSTSFRLTDRTRGRLSARAAQEGVSNTALLERLIVEGLDTLDHPGIVYRGPLSARRAALAAGPDVWEIVGRLRELQGSEEQRIATLAEESELHPRQIRLALDFAADDPEDVEARITENQAAAEASRRAAEQRAATPVTAFLLDETLAAAAAELLRDHGGHDARHVSEVGLDASPDADIAALARASGAPSSPRTLGTSPRNATSSWCSC